MFSLILALIGKHLALPQPVIDPRIAANLGIEAPFAPPVNIPLGILCFILAGLIFIGACSCLALVFRGEFEWGAGVIVPLAEVVIGLCGAWVVTLPALVIYLASLLVLRACQPWRLRRRRASDERKARTMVLHEPRNQEGYEWLARILADQERAREAAEVLDRWLRHDPDNRVIRKKMELLRQQGRAADERAIQESLPQRSEL